MRRTSFHLKEKILLKLGKTEKSVDPELQDKVIMVGKGKGAKASTVHVLSDYSSMKHVGL